MFIQNKFTSVCVGKHLISGSAGLGLPLTPFTKEPCKKMWDLNPTVAWGHFCAGLWDLSVTDWWLSCVRELIFIQNPSSWLAASITFHPLQPPWPSDEVADVSCREGFFRKDFLEWSSWLLRQQGGRLAKRPLNPGDAKEFMKQETISNSLTVYICIQKQSKTVFLVARVECGNIFQQANWSWNTNLGTTCIILCPR